MYSKITLIFLLGCCVWLSLSVYERYEKARDMENRRLESEVAYQELQERKQQLQEKVDYLGADAGVESEIRRNFDVARVGEEVVIIVDNDSPNEDIQPISPEPEEKPGFWSRLFTWYH